MRIMRSNGGRDFGCRTLIQNIGLAPAQSDRRVHLNPEAGMKSTGNMPGRLIFSTSVFVYQIWLVKLKPAA
jgi:hypothetical protein